MNRFTSRRIAFAALLISWVGLVVLVAVLLIKKPKQSAADTIAAQSIDTGIRRLIYAGPSSTQATSAQVSSSTSTTKSGTSTSASIPTTKEALSAPSQTLTASSPTTSTVATTTTTAAATTAPKTSINYKAERATIDYLKTRLEACIENLAKRRSAGTLTAPEGLNITKACKQDVSSRSNTLISDQSKYIVTIYNNVLDQLINIFNDQSQVGTLFDGSDSRLQQTAQYYEINLTGINDKYTYLATH